MTKQAASSIKSKLQRAPKKRTPGWKEKKAEGIQRQSTKEEQAAAVFSSDNQTQKSDNRGG